MPVTGSQRLNCYAQNARESRAGRTATELFQSDLACIAKFPAKSYNNKKEQQQALEDNRQILLHTRDTLFTPAALTKDRRYLAIGDAKREGETTVCEVADALVRMGYEESREETAAKDARIAMLLEQPGRNTEG